MKKIILVVLIFWFSDCFAALSNVVVSTDVNTVRIIDLSSSISETFTTITIGNEQGGETPASGTAIVSGTQITYTPQAGFVGFDNFKYSVFNNNTFVASATITIKTGNVVIGDSVANTPGQIVSNTLNLVCFSQDGSPSSSALTDLCSDFLNVNPTAGELDALVEELAPKEIDGQNYLSNTIATNQIDNVRKRLAALRQGIRGIDTTRLALKLGDEKAVTLASLFEQASRLNTTNKQSLSNNATPTESSISTPWGLFFGGNVGGGKHDETSNVDGYKFSTYGINAGMDYRVDSKTVVGGALGFNSSDMDINNNNGNVDVSGISFITYGSYFINQKLYIESIFARYQNDFKSNRIINYNVQGTPSSVTARGKTDNGVLSFSLGVGYEFYLKKRFTVNVSGTADYIKSTFDGYAESGAGGANLLIGKREQDVIISTINLQATYAKSYPSGVLIPQAGIAWKHEFDNSPPQINAVFFGDPSNTPIAFRGDKQNSDYFKLDLGFSWIYPGGNTMFVYGDTTLGQKNFSDYNISVGMRMELK